MPKYCVEFVADVCTLPSQDDSDCSDSREQDPHTVNPAAELDRELHLTPFIVPDHNNELPLHRENHFHTSESTDFVPNTSNSTYNCYQNINNLSRKGLHHELYTNSHVTSMGNTACCLVDGTRAAWDESDHPISTMHQFLQNTVPVHRTFVISRAVQCGDCTTTEHTMYNNHSYHEPLYLDTPVTETHFQSQVGPSKVNNHGFKLNNFPPHQQNDANKRSTNNKQGLRSNLPNNALSMVTSNSELSVDVSSLSAQRCSSVTPPVKTSVFHSQGTDKDQGLSNALLQEDDMDSLSATISAGSIPNLRENLKRHRQRPAPYTRPKRKIYNDASRRTNATVPTDWLESQRKGHKRHESNLRPKPGVPPLNDSLIQISSRSNLEQPTSGRLTQRYEFEKQKGSAFSTRNAEPMARRETSLPRTETMLNSKARIDSSSTLGDNLSVSSLDQPQTIKLPNSSFEQFQRRLNQEVFSEQPGSAKQASIQQDSASNTALLNSDQSINFYTDENCTLSKVTGNNVNKQDGSKSHTSSVILSNIEDKVEKMKSTNDPAKKCFSNTNLSKSKTSISHTSNQSQSNITKFSTTGFATKNSRKQLVQKVRSLSESRIPTTKNSYLQAYRASRLSANSKKELELTFDKSEQPGVERLNTALRCQTLSTDKQESLPIKDNNQLYTETEAKNDAAPEHHTTKPEIQASLSSVDTNVQLRQGRSAQRSSTPDILNPSELGKFVRRQCSLPSPQAKIWKTGTMFVSPDVKSNTNSKLGHSLHRHLNASGDHISTRAETNPKATLALDVRRPATSPSTERIDRRSTILKRISSPVPLKLPQANQIITPMNSTGTITNHTMKDVSSMLSSPCQLPVGRRRLNEGIMSVPLHTYTPQAGTRAKLVRHKFFIPESANIEAILADPDDRRIKAICERYKCDVEIYSKLPWCGFLQYTIVLAARDAATLRRCARTLDSRLNWCLDAQFR